MMHFIFLLLSLISIIIVSKVDKYYCKKNNTLERKNYFDDFDIDFYKSRLKLYKLSFVLSFIPWLNLCITFIYCCIIFLYLVSYLYKKLINSTLFNKLF